MVTIPRRGTILLLVLLTTGVATAAPPILRFREVQRNGVAGVTNMQVPNSMAASPDGKHVYVAADGSAAVAVFERDLGTGALTFVESQVQGVGGVDGIAGASGVWVSPDGAYVYIKGGASKAIAVFSRNAITGALTYIGKQTQGIAPTAGPFYMAASADGANVYVSVGGPNGVVVYARDSGTGLLTFVETQEQGVGGVPALDYPVQIVVSADGAHLYVASFGDFVNTGAVLTFARNSGTGALSFLATQSSPAVLGIGQPNGIAIDPTGSHVYVASWAGGALTALARNPITGALTFQESAGGNGGHRLAASPDGGRVYMAAWPLGLRVFTRNPVTGGIALAQTLTDDVDGVDGLGGSIEVAASADGRSVFGQGINDNAISVFDVACSDGVVDAGEQCDDDNVAIGDGCDEGCELEGGWTCSGAPSACAPICGDGLIVGGETCDDDGTTSGDGCSASCQLEAGWSCAGAPTVCAEICGDGLVVGDEACDDGDSNGGDGCSAGCAVEPDWACSGEPSTCFRERPVSALKLQLRRTSSGKEKALFVSKDANLRFPVRNSGDDPTVVGATVEWLSPAEGVGVMNLPASHWSANGDGTTYTFKNKTAPDGTSAIKSAQIRSGKGIKVAAKASGLPLAVAHGMVAVRIRTGTLRHCALFGGTIQADEVDRFQAKLAPAPAAADCTAASLIGVP